ncbi:MAG: hypothetical protein IKE75_06545 [Bacilli bacterium]|nr:hypothetical protein [Bacilli bacterium]
MEQNNSNNDWGYIGNAREELQHDIAGLNNGVYNPSSNNEMPVNDTEIKPRVRVEQDDIRDIARRNLARREREMENARKKEENIQNIRRVQKNNEDKMIHINDLKKRLDENKKNEELGENFSNFKFQIVGTLDDFKQKIKSLPRKAVSVGLVISLAGIVASTPKFIEKQEAYTDFETPMEQLASDENNQDLAKASELAEKGELSQDEINTLKEANVGDNVVVGHWDDAPVLNEAEASTGGQKYTYEQASHIASMLAQKEKLSPEEAKFIQEFNNGKYNEPVVLDQFAADKIDAPHIR